MARIRESFKLRRMRECAVPENLPDLNASFVTSKRGRHD